MVLNVKRLVQCCLTGVTVVVVTAGCNPASLRSSPAPPNVILILADDLGYGELGSYGQEKIRTPHLDRMATEGMRFTQFYSGNPVCAPSRAALLTGLHTGRAPVRGNRRVDYVRPDGREAEGNQPLPAGTQSLGTMLKKSGYATAAMGKWGLGGPGSTGEPILHGIDLFYGYLDQRHAHNYYPDHLWRGSNEGLVQDKLDNDGVPAHHRLVGNPNDPASYAIYEGAEYAPDVTTEHALQFIRDNRDRPFFLYLPYTIPHVALQVPGEELDQYSFPETPYAGDDGYLPHRRPRAAYAGMISRMDGYVGELLALIDELDLEENTLILFTSDNGATYTGGVDATFFESVGPLRGLKNSVYEGGIRVPMIAHWPGNIAPGSTTDHVSALWDVLPTLAEVTNAEAPDGIDGISFLPTLMGRSEAQEEHAYLYWENHGPCRGEQAVRMGDWKGVRRGVHAESPDAIELYHLATDIGETRDVAAEHPGIVEQIRAAMQEAHTPSPIAQWNIHVPSSSGDYGGSHGVERATCAHPSLRRSAPVN